MDIFLLIVGLALILVGANVLTDGAMSLAGRFGIPEFIIGVTVVGIGTSMPEMAVSVISSVRGGSDVAIGNVVGSNMFNTLVIVGISALITPIALSKSNIMRELPFGVAAAAVFLAMAAGYSQDGNGHISRAEGVVLILLFVLFMVYSVYVARRDGAQGDDTLKVKKRSVRLSAVMIIGGLAALVAGGSVFLDKAVLLAREIGVSEAVIAVVLVATGTSLPELAVSAVAAAKGRTGIALGNVLGSNISNILLVLGTSAVISPLQMGGVRIADVWILLGVSALLMVTAYTFRRKHIDRAEGALFIIIYAAYIYWLLVR